jgi:rare lipoprotein A
MIRFWVLSCVTVLTGCLGPAANPHYELGRPYQVRGVWYYPRENFTLDETGLAAVYGGGHASLTADGERFDPSVVMAGHPTLQLPAVARLTNLENGRSILVRINDRGNGDPGRLITVTRRTAALLGMRDATQVRLQVLAEDSHAASDDLPGHPQLAMAAAPLTAVVATDLAPPSGTAPSAPSAATNQAPPTGAQAAPTGAISVVRPPETVTQGAARPGQLWVRLDAFEEYPYALAQQARMRDMGASIDRIFDGRVRRFRVRVGPVATVREADQTLRDALGRGIPDARIVVE